MSNRPGIDPNDWHASKHGCPPGIVKERAWIAARDSFGVSHETPAEVVQRARAFASWLAVPFAIVESGAPFWRAVNALHLAVEDHRSPLRDKTTEGILATADLWVAALSEWRVEP